MADARNNGEVDFRYPRWPLLLLGVGFFGGVFAYVGLGSVGGSSAETACVESCNEPGSTWLFFAVAWGAVVLVALTWVWMIRVRLVADGVERRGLLGTKVTEWSTITGVSTTPGIALRPGRAVLVLVGGGSVTLRLLWPNGRRPVKTWFSTPDAEQSPLVVALRARLDANVSS